MENKSILLYSQKVTNRLTYIFNLYIDELLGYNIIFTSNIEMFTHYQGIKLSYNEEPLNDELFFASTDLLFENNIRIQDIKNVIFENKPALFPIQNSKAALPFDPFAAGFYLVTRYEEYLPSDKDIHGRYKAENSIAFKLNFLQIPIINYWVITISQLIKTKYDNFNPKIAQFNILPTIDLDRAFDIKLSTLKDHLRAYLGSLIRLNLISIIERSLIILRLKKDPFDTFDYLINVHSKYNLNSIFFVLYSQGGNYDINNSVKNQNFCKLIKWISQNADVGIHPSYSSNTNITKLENEIHNLSKVIDKQITKSRQHFLKLDTPKTYQNLLALKITDDYTMGYASQIGFRASICTSYSFYDLETDQVTSLRIHPFAFMDGTLLNYLHIPVTEAMQYIKPLLDEVKKTNGTFISLWHNPTINNKLRIGWRNVYEEMLNYACKV